MPAFKLNDKHCYQIRFIGAIEDDFILSYCPSATMVEHQDKATLLSNILTDQSGIVGLIRHLHNVGCTILDFSIEQEGELPVE